MSNSANRYWARTTKFIQRDFAFLMLVALLCAAGCGGAYDSLVAGVVTLDGKAVPRGAVTFQSVNGGATAYGLITDDGSYTVRTGRERGLPSGDYEVTVSANEAPSAAALASGLPPPPGKAISPTWYRMKETSGLKYTVKPGKNVINLELTSKPPAGWKPTGQRQI